jgi:hypothetical protein
MYAAIEKCQHEGISPKLFCQKNELSYHAFYYWLKKYRSEQIGNMAETGFLPVKLEETPEAAQGQLIVHYPNGIRVNCPFNTPAHLLQTLIIP